VGLVAALAAGQVTFGSFNTLQKINPPLVRLWSQILHQVPGSRILLKNNGYTSQGAQQNTRQLFADHGITSDRITLAARVPAKADHLALYGRIDVALDTFPYHGTTTTCEAMWMGVPVITLAGAMHMSRVGASLLHAVGLDDLVATTPDQYVQLAVNLAQDINRLVELRAGLRARMIQSPLMDAAGFARDMEAVYRQIWRNWCAGNPTRE
jgi:predicted O-linked N-acetylglucosamine transferase (SPINDLY family)